MVRWCLLFLTVFNAQCPMLTANLLSQCFIISPHDLLISGHFVPFLLSTAYSPFCSLSQRFDDLIILVFCSMECARSMMSGSVPQCLSHRKCLKSAIVRNGRCRRSLTAVIRVHSALNCEFVQCLNAKCKMYQQQAGDCNASGLRDKFESTPKGKFEGK